MKNNKLEFETLKSNKNRLYLLCGIVRVVVLLITIIVSNTFAKYRVRDSVPIINSEINYKVPDLNMVSLYVANEDGSYVEADTIPSSGYILNTEQSLLMSIPKCTKKGIYLCTKRGMKLYT